MHKVSTPDGYPAALAAGDLDGNGVLDSAAEVDAALASGALVDDGIVKYFVCTLNKCPPTARPPGCAAGGAGPASADRGGGGGELVLDLLDREHVLDHHRRGADDSGLPAGPGRDDL